MAREPAPPPATRVTSNKPAFVTVKVPVAVKVNSVYDSPPTVIVDELPPVAIPYSPPAATVFHDDT
jgi:hypothetical protein